METPVTPAATSSPSHRSRSTPGTHCRALTVNLMELLESSSCSGREDESGWADVGSSSGTAAYAAFDPEQLWQAAAPVDNILPVSMATAAAAGGGVMMDANHHHNDSEKDVEGSTGASSNCVLIVFGVGPLNPEELLSQPQTSSTFSGGSVMQFLISRTDFMDHLLFSSLSLPSGTCDCKEDPMKNEERDNGIEKTKLLVKEDGHKEILLFTDVNIERPDDIRAISVVYVQLTKEECRVTDKEAAQHRASQVIKTIQTLFLGSSQTIFWVDFTGILDPTRTEVQKELRDAWWTLVVTSASGSLNSSTLRLIALVNPSAIPQLHKEFEHLEEAVRPRDCSHTTIIEKNISSPKPMIGSPLTWYCTDENADVRTLIDIGLSNAKGKNNIIKDELIQSMDTNILTCHGTKNNPETCTDGEASVTDKDDDDDDDDSYDDDECELIWERHLRVMTKGGNDKVVKVCPPPPPPPPSSSSSSSSAATATATATSEEDTNVKVREENDENEFIWQKYVEDLNISVKELPSHEVSNSVSALFIECSSETTLSSSLSTDTSIRDLLVLWSALGIQHSPRLIVVIADGDYYFENTLLSWVKIPCAQNALIFPIFVVSELNIHSSDDNVRRESLPSIPTNHKHKESLMCYDKFVRVLTFAVEYFGIDVHSSACLAMNNNPFQQVADQLGFQAVGDYQYISSWVTQMNGEEATELSMIQKMLDVEAARESAFLELCHTNSLAQLLRDYPRRPELFMQRVNNMRVGITRPVVCDAVALVSTVPTETRLGGASNSILLFFTEEQLSNVYRFMISFFTREVFSIAVDIVRSHNSDYFSGHHFATVGYFRYELTSWVRRHVLVALHMDFQPFLALAGDQSGGTTTPPHWSRVIRHMSCTCTPRRHEKLLYTETGEKKCRHVAQLLYWFLRKCVKHTTSIMSSSHSQFVRPNTRQQRRLRGSRLAPCTTSTVKQHAEEREKEEEEEGDDDETVKKKTMRRSKNTNNNKKMRMDEGDFSSPPLEIVDVTAGGNNTAQAGREEVQPLTNDGDVSLLEFAALLGIT
ncbi:uncharacterized protein TM35_000222040 [Trypanosoma theileri]|uniref:Uncharacterized protein n=1 Tax=Trypanosoma theileri TaxID=67003 RepID=A0A1X0NRS3_9TRYP|nr:uncharacterized protein TM35_000222040 [Trypanosoma theileri]ORC87405.1 hypothetical protein TM35_000222040 [Trypanosoma theileri]